MTIPRVLGVDIGGVVIARSSTREQEDTSFFGDRYLETPEVPGAFAALAQLVGSGRFAAVHFVSKAGEATARKTREWLAHRDAYAATGIPAACLHFCRERYEKRAICLIFGVTDFVDDRVDVLQNLDGAVARRYLFAPAGDRHRPAQPPVGLIMVGGWGDAAEALLGVP